MAAQEQDRHVDLPTVEPDVAEIFTLDYSLIWLVSIVIISFVAFLYTKGKPDIGVLTVVFVGLLVVCWYCLIHKKWFRKNQSPAIGVAFESISRSASRLTGSSKGFSESPEVGELIAEEQQTKRPKPIRKIGKVQFNAHQLSGGMMGWAHDRRKNTYSATILCKFSSFALSGSDAQDRRLARFADLLDTMSESGGNIAWRDQTFIGEFHDADHNLGVIRKGANLTRRREDCPNQEEVLASIAAKSEDSLFHRTTITLGYYKPTIDKEAKKQGLSAPEMLTGHLGAFLSQALGPEGAPSPIGLTSAKVLTYNNLVLENRLALDPVYGQFLWQRWMAARDESEMLDEQIAWPGNWDFEPKDYCQLGETFHRCTYIPKFARRGMPVDQFDSIIRVPVRKTITTVFQMLNPEQGMKHAEVSRAAAANSTLKRAVGSKASKARLDSAAEEARSFEIEVAYRRSRVGRVRTYIDLWGSSPEEVMASQVRLRAAIVDARFTNETLEGRHHWGIFAAMPLGRGLASPTGPFASTLRWLGM